MPSPRPGSNRNLPLTKRVLAPIELQGHVALLRARAPAEGIEPSRVRLTAGRLTIRLRWNERRGTGASRPPSFGVELSKNRALARGQTYPFTRGGEPTGRLRGQGSNLHCWVQRPASLPLDDPEIERPERCVGSEGIEPSPHRVRAGCAAATPRACGQWDARDSNPHLSG
jgi:hypothetical protein